MRLLEVSDTIGLQSVYPGEVLPTVFLTCVWGSWPKCPVFTEKFTSKSLFYRLTSDEYCLHLALYLCEILKTWPRLSTDRPEHVFIGTLVRRLWYLLSPKSRDLLLSKYSSPESIHVCYWFDGWRSYSEHVVERFVNFHRNPSPANYVSMVSVPMWS